MPELQLLLVILIEKVVSIHTGKPFSTVRLTIQTISRTNTTREITVPDKPNDSVIYNGAAAITGNPSPMLLITSSQTITSVECHAASLRKVHDARPWGRRQNHVTGERQRRRGCRPSEEQYHDVRPPEDRRGRSGPGSLRRGDGHQRSGMRCRSILSTIGEGTSKQPSIDKAGFTVVQPRWKRRVIGCRSSGLKLQGALPALHLS